MALRVAPSSPACQPDWREPEDVEDGFRLGGQVGAVLFHQADEHCLQGNTSHDRPGLRVILMGGYQVYDAIPLCSRLLDGCHIL
jgi:hypothetical protein